MEGRSAKRIAVLGPESSGKTTLCAQLNEALNSTLVNEYARTFLSARVGPSYTLEDLILIAESQYRYNEIQSSDLLICDTEMSTIAIWALERFKVLPDAIAQLEAEQHFDLYVLCKPDMPWQYDPLRENSDDRGRLFELYKQRLDELSRTYLIVTGDEKSRLACVVEAIEHI